MNFIYFIQGEELATLISDQDNLKKFIDKEQENYIKFRKQGTSHSK